MKCRIFSVEGLHDPIELPDGKPVILGRSPETQITDSKVSRQHTQFMACYRKQIVEVKQLGTNASEIDGKLLHKQASLTVNCVNGPRTINLLESRYAHKIEFESSTEFASSDRKNTIPDMFKPKGQKRKSEVSETQVNSKKSKINGDKVDIVNNQECSDSDDEEKRRVEEQLRRMKAEYKKTEAATKPDQSPRESSVKKRPLPVSATATIQDKWEEHGKLLMYTSVGVKASNKIAGFDIDSTIICTQSGKVFATHAGDWKIMLSETPGKLKKLIAEGYKVVFFTNQNGIQRGKVKVPEYKKKIENIISKLGIPVQVYVSTGPGAFRKPGLGMWNFLCERCNAGIEIDADESFYVGDAAGRPVGWAPGKKKDFSLSDRLFALNAGLKFYTPEEYFLGHKKAPFNMPDFDPRNIPVTKLPENITSKDQEVIVAVGFPASGKSFFSKTYLVPKGYVHVNRDTLKTWQKCVEATKRALREGKSVVVDNTNPDVESRLRYLKCAKEAGVNCRSFVFNTSFTQCKHNERFREMTDKSHDAINDMVMNSFKSKFVEPKMSEGFSEIVKINFVPNFTNNEHERIYKQFLLEK